MEKYIVSRDDSIYEAFPDLVITETGRLICVYTECVHHGDRDLSRIVYRTSDNRGKSWSPVRALTERRNSEQFYNCARISKLSDGRLAVTCDYESGWKLTDIIDIKIWFSSDDGESWSEPMIIPGAHAIMPDKLIELKSGRWLIAAHSPSETTGKLTEYLWYSDDKGNSWMGYDCFKTISRDGGLTWNGVYNVPLPGCHRPTAGILKDGRILITYRFMQGGSGWLGSWTQNTFGALMPRESALVEKRNEQSARIFPIDFDRSSVSDTGYTGWAQFDDGEIYVVNYMVDDAPKAFINGSSFRAEDYLI